MVRGTTGGETCRFGPWGSLSPARPGAGPYAGRAGCALPASPGRQRPARLGLRAPVGTARCNIDVSAAASYRLRGGILWLPPLSPCGRGVGGEGVGAEGNGVEALSPLPSALTPHPQPLSRKG